jgi:leukotriene-A4 hydrolase
MTTTRRFALAAALLLLSLNATHRRVVTPPDLPPPMPRTIGADIFSAAQPTAIETKHLSLDLTVDFTTRTLRGSATHEVVNHTGTSTFIVDTDGLDVSSVLADGAPAPFHFATPTFHDVPLVIEIRPTTRLVRIEYRSRDTARATRWLTPLETRGHVSPFLWTTNEPDLGRTWIPMQDTPGVRFTYDATVHVPRGLMAVMSAENRRTVAPDGVYHFTMPHAIPGYLIALAVGRLEFRELDERTGVYAEPELIDDAAREMAPVPEMVDTAERIIGRPYPFDRYDLLFAPQFGGGMENAQLNFLSPDAITGNRDAIVQPSGLVAHELSHAWFGDFVTCSTWRDLWLNEGFATYYEKRIHEAMTGWERAEVGLMLDQKALLDYLGTPPPERLTVLHRDFSGTEQVSFTIIWYQKAEMFLKMLEDTLGREAYDRGVREYLARNGGHWVDDVSFLQAMRDVSIAGDSALEAKLQLDAWVYGTGLPSNGTAPTTSALWNRIGVQAAAFRAGATAASLDRTGWGPLEQNLFLQQIPDVIADRLGDLEETFHFSAMTTPPLAWLAAEGRTRDMRYLPALESYLARGIQNSLVVWYEFGKTGSGRAYGRAVYPRVQMFYSPGTRSIIESYLRIFTPSASASTKDVIPKRF